jgi:hypothetical protein
MRWKKIQSPTLLYLLVTLDFTNSIGLLLDWLIQVLLFKVLWNVPWVTFLRECLVFVDDILVFSETFEEHIIRFENVFQRLSSHGLKLRGFKCKFFKTSVSYLGEWFFY